MTVEFNPGRSKVEATEPVSGDDGELAARSVEAQVWSGRS
jgi:hypothetical protein